MVVLERRYRVLVDVEVELSAITEPDELSNRKKARSLTPLRGAFADERDSLAAQQRLLNALLQDPSALNTWLRREIVSHVLGSGLERFCIDTVEEELLRPVLACLPPPDREVFEVAVEVDEFCEFADLFLDATSAKLVDIVVTEGYSGCGGSTRALALRTYRVVIDVEATIRGIDEPEAEARWHTLQESCDWEFEITPDQFARLQRSLLTTLQTCEDELDLWLKQEVLREILDYGYEQSLEEPSDGEIFGPVISRLDPADRVHFEALLGDDTFYDHARAFHRALRVSTREVSVAALPKTSGARWQAADLPSPGPVTQPIPRWRTN
jgi:hypothetical protein